MCVSQTVYWILAASKGWIKQMILMIHTVKESKTIFCQLIITDGSYSDRWRCNRRSFSYPFRVPSAPLKHAPFVNIIHDVGGAVMEIRRIPTNRLDPPL